MNSLYDTDPAWQHYLQTLLGAGHLGAFGSPQPQAGVLGGVQHHGVLGHGTGSIGGGQPQGGGGVLGGGGRLFGGPGIQPFDFDGLRQRNHAGAPEMMTDPQFAAMMTGMGGFYK